MIILTLLLGIQFANAESFMSYDIACSFKILRELNDKSIHELKRAAVGERTLISNEDRDKAVTNYIRAKIYACIQKTLSDKEVIDKQPGK